MLSRLWRSRRPSSRSGTGPASHCSAGRPTCPGVRRPVLRGRGRRAGGRARPADAVPADGQGRHHPRRPQLHPGRRVGAAIADQASDDAVLQHFGDGATLVLQGLHRTWRRSSPSPRRSPRSSATRCRSTPTSPRRRTPASATTTTCTTSSSSRSRGRSAGGSAPRCTTCRCATSRGPTTGPRSRRRPSRAPLIEQTFAPGDCLYLPRGYLHSATALGGTSIHLTIGVHAWTRRHLADELVRAAVACASRPTRAAGRFRSAPTCGDGPAVRRRRASPLGPPRGARPGRRRRDVLGDRQAVVARELTKLFETIRRGTLPELARHSPRRARRRARSWC